MNATRSIIFFKTTFFLLFSLPCFFYPLQGIGSCMQKQRSKQARQFDHFKPQYVLAMIQDLKQLMAFTENLASQSPLIQSEIVMKGPGSSPADIERLKKELPHIPTSYLEVIEKIKLDTTSLHYFQFSPAFSPKQSLVEALVEWNQSNENPLHNLHKKNKTYEVARFESLPIAVVFQKGEFSAGQVVVYNFETSPTGHIHVLANSFEQFLLLVGNLAQLSQTIKHNNEPNTCDKVIKQFQPILEKIFPNHPKETKQVWQSMIESSC